MTKKQGIATLVGTLACFAVAVATLTLGHGTLDALPGSQGTALGLVSGVVGIVLHHARSRLSP